MVQDYVKTEWVDKKTIITAENMNKIEEQIDVVTDDVIAIKEQLNPELIESLSEQVTGMTETIESLKSRIHDLEVKLHYVSPSEKPVIVTAVDAAQASAKIVPEPGQVIKALRVVEIPEDAVKWQNKFSSFFGVNEAGKTTGTSNPSGSTAPHGTKFEHIGNLDPTKGVQELDKIEDLYAILCDFDFEKAATVEVEDIKKHYPETVKIKYVRHMIDLLDSEDRVLKTLKVDIYNPN